MNDWTFIYQKRKFWIVFQISPFWKAVFFWHSNWLIIYAKRMMILKNIFCLEIFNSIIKFVKFNNWWKFEIKTCISDYESKILKFHFRSFFKLSHQTRTSTTDYTGHLWKYLNAMNINLLNTCLFISLLTLNQIRS